jgi:hypothetical protein
MREAHLPVVRVPPREFYSRFIFHRFPTKTLPQNAKCRRSSALDLTSRRLPTFRCRFDSDRPLHKFKHLQALLPQRGVTKEQKPFLPLAESIQPTCDGPPACRGQGLCIHVQRQSAVCAPHQFLHRLNVPPPPFRSVANVPLFSSGPWSSNSNQVYSVEGADAVN